MSPAETLRVYNINGAIYLGESALYDTTTCIAIAGNAGSRGGGTNGDGQCQTSLLSSGVGGGTVGGTQPYPSNNNHGRCGAGGTQSAGGAGAPATPTWGGTQGNSGAQWVGGSGGFLDPSGNEVGYGGTGGAGWFGGGGGSATNDGNRAGGGGGGSSRIQTPSADPCRDGHTRENAQGPSTGRLNIL